MRDRRQNHVRAADLHVMLERALRRETRNCVECTFSLPYSLAGMGNDWSVIPANSCSDSCRMVLEDLIARFRTKYALAEGQGSQPPKDRGNHSENTGR